jgi:AcrR family transcriptional regulator
MRPAGPDPVRAEAQERCRVPSKVSKAGSGSDAKPKSRTKVAAKKKAAARLKDARSRMYHDLIFEAAECVFGQKGYERATMNEIAEEAGVSLKTLYATFESKHDLYAEIGQRRASAFYAAMRVAMEGDDDPRDRLSRAISAYTGFLYEHQNWLRIHLHGRVAWAFRPKDEATAARWDEGRDTFSKLLQDGMKAGVFYDGDPDEIALLVQTLMQVVIGRSVQRGEERAETVAAAILLQVERMLFIA